MAGLVLVFYLKGLNSILAVCLTIYFIWIFVPGKISKRSRQNFTERPWIRNLVYVFKYPLIVDSHLPRYMKTYLETSELSIYGLANNALIQSFHTWKSEGRRKKFLNELRRLSAKESQFFLLESAFLRFKANTLIMQRNFLLSTFRLAQDLQGPEKSAQSLLRQTTLEAAYQPFAEYPSECKKTSERLNLFPTSSFQNTASYPSPTGEETGNTNSSQIFDAQNHTARWIHVKELEEQVAKLEYELQCKESQLDILKRETANLKKSLIKRSSNTSSIRNGTQP